LPPADAEAHIRAMRAYVNAKNETEREAAGQKLEQMHKGFSERDPKLQGNIENLNRALGLKTEERVKAAAEKTAEQARQQTRVQNANSGAADDLNACCHPAVHNQQRQQRQHLPAASSEQRTRRESQTTA
jgi:hypothetical protein